MTQTQERQTQGAKRKAGSSVPASTLRVGSHEDSLEHEADRVAASVMGPLAPIPTRGRSPEPRVARRAGRGGGPTVAPASVHQTLREPGDPLPAATRSFFEPRFGHDFSKVRVHHDAAAARSARDLHAAAYTVGQRVVFADGAYSPGDSAGRQLLAHELAHVVQQRASGQVGVVRRRSLLDGFLGLFAGEDFPDQELQAYLGHLDQTNRIEDYNESDNKARAVVRRWQAGDAAYLLPPRRKLLLIQEMLSGFTGDEDEQAILLLLRGSSEPERRSLVSQIGRDVLDSSFHGEEQDQLDALLDQRPAQGAASGASASDAGGQGATRDGSAASGAASDTFAPELVLELQRRFTSNAEATNRLNCIEIIRTIAPQLYASDPELAERVRARLSRLRGRTLTMPDLGRAMSELGLASDYRTIRFNPDNGNRQPTGMQASAWQAILDMVGDVPGWHIFGLAVFDGYHSVTVLVDNRPDGPRLYWADQWRIDPGEDFDQAPGSVSGFRRYEQAGFDSWLSRYTISRWNTVFEEKGKRYSTTLHIWKFRSGLSTPDQAPSSATEERPGVQRSPLAAPATAAPQGFARALAGQVLKRPGQPLGTTLTASLSPHIEASGAPEQRAPGRSADAEEQAAREVEAKVSSAGVAATKAGPALDFSAVRVHTGPLAEASARAFNAAAYTVGNHVVFGRGVYQPHSATGRGLLAHELTHVVQQRGIPGRNTVQRRIASNYAEIERRLSYDVFDWAITDQEAREVLGIMATLSDRDLADTVTALDRDGLFERLLDNIADTDRESFAVLIARMTRRRSVSRSASRIVDRLSYGVFDWAITDQDARDVLQVLLGLESQQLRTMVAHMVNQGVFDRFLDNLPAEDHRRFAAFIARLRDIRAEFSRLVTSTVGYLRSRPGGAGQAVRQRVQDTGYGGSRSTWNDLDEATRRDWQERARRAIRAVVQSVRGTDLQEIVDRAELVFSPEAAERLNAYAYVNGGNQLMFGRGWVEDAEENVRNVWQSIAHELGGHEEFGLTWSWEIMKAAVRGLTPEERRTALGAANSLYSAYGYLETEIYAELREEPHRIATSGGDRPSFDVPRQVRRIREAFGPDVGRQLVMRLYYRVADDPRVSESARALLRESIQDQFHLFPISEEVAP